MKRLPPDVLKCSGAVLPAVALAAVVLLLPACDSGGGTTPPPPPPVVPGPALPPAPPPPPAKLTTLTFDAKDLGATKLNLLEPGAEPRRIVSLATGGGEEHLKLRLRNEMRIQAGDVTLPKPRIPAVDLRMTVAPAEAPAEGLRRFAFSVDSGEPVQEAGINKKSMKRMQRRINKMIGLEGWFDIDGEGLTRQIGMQVPEDAEDELQELVERTGRAMSRVSVPLPTEPIGEGARWETVGSTLVQGVRADQTTSWKVRKLEDTAVELGAKVTQSAKPQDTGGTDGETSGKLLSYESQGSGRTEIAPGRLVPVRSVLTMRSVAKIETKKDPMIRTTDIILEIEAVETVKDVGDGEDGEDVDDEEDGDSDE